MTDTVTIGTAGHIDHGKTALVRALTGVDCDRLPEERERGITIELGFAALSLDGVAGGDGADAADAADDADDEGPAVQAGLVDVPGHERFVRTMLAGAAAIDVGLLVVAADDGVMPQTREHLAILDLLGVRHAVVALAKCDLAEPEWCALVQDDLREVLLGTSLAGAPIVPTSARRGDGIDALRTQLATAARAAAADRRHAVTEEPFRLMVDRSFALTGRGTVVTGTAASGSVAVGDELEIHPGDRTARVRELHVHGRSRTRVERGSRVAIALAGVHHSEIARGDELTSPGAVRDGAMLVVRLRMLPAAARSLRPRERVRLHLGTAVRSARVRLLDADALEPGAEGLALLAVDGPVPAIHGQPFVLRAESPAMTLGGGAVLVPGGRPVRRSDAITRATLETLADNAATGSERLDAALALRRDRRVPPTAAWTDAGLVGAEAATAMTDLRARGAVRDADDGQPVHAATVAHWTAAVLAAVDRHHRDQPLSAGLPRDQLASAPATRRVPDGDLGWVVDAAVAAGTLREAGGGRLARRAFEPELAPRHRTIRTRVLAAYRDAGFRPPDPPVAAGPEARRTDVDAMMRLSVSEGDLVHLGGGTYLDAEHERLLRTRVREHLTAHPTEGLTMSGLRQLLETTRKHAVPFGEYLDRIGLTRRRGDVRVLADG